MGKKFILVGLLSLTEMIYSQKKNVGINTTSPKQTLDVEGTVRLKEPGSAANNSVLLGVDAEGKIVKREASTVDIDSQNSPFFYKTFTADVNKGYDNDSYNGSPHTTLNTGIDSGKYVVTVTNFYLTRKGSAQTPAMKLCSVSDGAFTANVAHQDPWNNRVTTLVYRDAVITGSLSPNSYKTFGNSHSSNHPVQQKLSLLGNKLWAFHTPIFFSIPAVKAYQSGGTWHIDADFPDTQDAKYGDLTWHFDVLIVNNEWSTIYNLN